MKFRLRWIDIKLISKMIFWKMGCLVVTSNSVKLKNISSWPNFRAKTTKNHFRFNFHFKWLVALENRRERERGRKKEEIATSPALRRPLTSPAPRMHWSRSRLRQPRRSQSRLRLSGFDDFFSGFCLCFEEWMVLYIRLVIEKMWENWATSRKCVFKNTTKHQKIFSETFFEMEPNTWKYFPFWKIAFPENTYFLKILLHEPNAALNLKKHSDLAFKSKKHDFTRCFMRKLWTIF